MKRIAVVEDELYMREELCSLLRKAGYEALEITVPDAVSTSTSPVLPPSIWIEPDAVSKESSSARIRSA